ncbi:hypothetical protein GPOL_c30950 [Gordonia polyisoprenivorans VH2]|uniref:TobH protein n=2 Tax=Gordonia polyisoprenivorans TaxID=84595 RepID=H6MVL6_GORPV|nr:MULTISPECIES: hypothetical protein [Gordonia]AFA74110.1 hypothetical protein GPOL_c30950 [Gordonia polyisoprenivorans VH2]MBE7193399.1 hypothetical protein [Gordonia polyisoprenivorans]MDF3283708.1 hypothetical protein [Gordonia sp. N1V]NKY03738.1 hypothetical protein [Gordonia polyisoprenivorans]OPX14468.1 hypothetical protein B1964_14925 [Gordonia sp. i37]
MRTGAPDLDDVDDLIAADTEGLLHAAALAGAQVRSVAEAVREGVAEPLSELRPRSVVIVCAPGGPAAGATAMVCAMLATRVDVPIVCTSALPGWIGPLDVVVLAGIDGGDMTLADAAARSLRRRAEVVISAPIEGPLRDALGGNGIDFSPRVDVDPRFRFPGFVAVLLAVFTALTQVRFTGSAPTVSDLADALDSEAAADHPARETFHNQAKILAARLGEGPVMWTGDSPATLAVADRAAAVLFAVSGSRCATADLADISRVSRDIWSVAEAGSAADSLFYDPQIDGPRGDGPPRVMVATTAAREWDTRRRIGALASTEVLVGADADAQVPPVVGGDPAEPADAPGDLTSLLVLMLRIEMAAVYLRLIGAEQG